MVETIVESEFPVSVDILFAYVHNLETMQYYNSSIQGFKWIEKDIDHSSCKLKIGLSIINFEADYIITEYEKNKKFIAKCKHSSLEFEDTYIFESRNGNSSYLKIIDKMQLKGLLALSEGFLGPNMKREMSSNMNTLVSMVSKLST